MSAVSTNAQFPEKLSFLFENHRYKVLEGGRGGGKSENVAQALLIHGSTEQQIILCTREIQHSIKDSVHATLKQWIGQLKFVDGRPFSEFYSVKQTYIVGKNDTEFIFSGLSNIDSLKSIAKVRRCWVEEAQTVKKASWEKLIPSIRWENKETGEVSEIWLTYNPELVTDETYRRFHLNPPRSAKVVQINWRDNPWFPEVLRVEMEDLRRISEDDYLHVYEGQPRENVVGAIYGSELKKATEEGRICTVPYNRAKPVDTVWDLGFGDLTAIWFCQSYDGFYHFIDYVEGDGLTIADYLIKLQGKGYLYGTDWLPHDGVDTIIHKRLAGDRSRSIEMLMRDAGRNVRIVPKVHIADRINAARTIFPQCRFDENKCADGIQALRHYQWGPLNEHGVRKRDPLHNWASHASDAFTMAALAVKQPKKEAKLDKTVPRYPIAAGGSYAPFA